jgi:PAS domain S-box-containing protein
MPDLSALPDLLPWPFLVCGRDGRVLHANPLFEKSLGRQLKPRSRIDDIFVEMDNGRPVSSLLFSAARWSSWSGLLELRPAKGEAPLRAAKVILLPDPRYAQQVWVLLADDAEVDGQQLLTPRSGMSLARTLIENSPDFIIFRDLEGRILQTSRSLDEFLALPYRGNVADLRLPDILSAATAAEFAKFDEEVKRTGRRVRQAVTHFEAVNGKSRLVRIVHELTKGGAGLPPGLLTFAVNITETVDEHNRLRIALERAEEFAAARWQFVANVTHEIRNPLNAIHGLCEAALADADRPPAETFRRILRSVAELEDTVRDVLDFSRLDHGGVAVDRAAFNPVRALEEVAAQFLRPAGRKGVAVNALCDAASPRAVLGDAVKFRRVAANLIGNAVKFTSKGHVTARLTFSPRGDRLQATLRVEDTGIGIPQDRLESIFEPFTQADSTTTRRFGGTGLGLTIVRSLVQAMDGFIKVASTPGKGSVFTATMLVDPDAEHPERPAPDLAGRRIMVAGGPAETRGWLCDSLARWGATCVAAEDERQAESLWKEAAKSDRPFDLALVDIPDDLHPNLPELPREKMTFLASPECGLVGRDVLAKPIGLTGLWNKFAGAAPDDEAEARSAHRQGRPGRKLRVLLAEDNEVNREVAESRLRKAGHEVTAVGDGAQAVEAWRKGGFDVAVLDIQMPVMDGLAAAEAIRREEAAGARGRIGLLAMTAMTQESDRARCEAAGFDAHLSKPVRGAELLEKIVALGERSPASAEGEFIDAVAEADEESAEDLRAAGRAFLRHADGMIERLKSAAEATGRPDLTREAHGVKGMLSLMSCAALARVAGGLERQPTGPGSDEAVRELIDGLRRLKERLSSESPQAAHGPTEDQARG